MPGFRLLTLALTLLAWASGTQAGPTACPAHYLDGQAPEFARPVERARELCFSAFAVLHSGATRGPRYAAAHLIGRVLERGHPERVNAFHAEAGLPKAERAEMADFRASGFDRGHLEPSADMATEEAQHESFSLANMVMQRHESNAGLWAHIEAATRDLAMSRGELYVITGPIFGPEPRLVHGRVPVPAAMFKAVLDPRTGEGAAFIAPNAAGSCWESVSLDELRERVGVDAFPGRAVGRLKLPEPGVPPAEACPAG